MSAPAQITSSIRRDTFRPVRWGHQFAINQRPGHCADTIAWSYVRSEAEVSLGLLLGAAGSVVPYALSQEWWLSCQASGSALRVGQ